MHALLVVRGLRQPERATGARDWRLLLHFIVIDALSSSHQQPSTPLHQHSQSKWWTRTTGWETPPEPALGGRSPSRRHPRRDPCAGRASPPVLGRRPPHRIFRQQLPWSYWKPQWTAKPLLFPLFALNWLLFNDGKDKKDVLGPWLTTSAAENKENASCLPSIPIQRLGNCWSKPSL